MHGMHIKFITVLNTDILTIKLSKNHSIFIKPLPMFYGSKYTNFRP